MRSVVGLTWVVLVVSGCSSSSGGPSGPSGADGGGTEGGSGADAASEGAAAAESGADDAASGTDANDDGPTVCNSLVNSGQPVTAMQVAEDAPAFTGGTVVDGTYALTSETIYTGPGGATGPTSPQTITIRIAGSSFQVAKDSDPPTSTYLFAPSGTTYTATGECPPMLGDIVGSYTATATTFTVSLAAPGGDGGGPTVVEAFTKE